MNYLRRSNSSSGNAEGGSTAATAALRSIYSSTGSGQRALVFTVEVPERGPLGLDLKARFSANVHPQRGAVVKGFKPNRHGKKGYIESTGRVKEKDILVQLHDTKVDDMPFDAIVDLAAQLQDNPMAWPLRLEFKREPEVQDAEPAKPKGFSGFLRAASMSLPGLSSSTAHSMTTAPPPPTITSASAQDGSFQDKLNYFRGFFKDRLPTSTESKAKKVDMPPLPAPDIVNDMYRELLMKRNVPEDVLDELVRIESLENKWSIVWSAKQHENDESSQGYIADAIKIAEALVELHWDNKGLALLETLHRKIASSTAEWTDQFVVSYGLDYLTMKMPEPSPFSIEHHYKSFEKASRFCENIIRILLSLSHFASGIDAITSTLGLVDRLALCFHTESSDVKKITLQVLGIICYNSAEGHQSVVHSFSNYKEVKGEMIRFTCLRDALKSTRYNLLFKEDVLSFINILVNKGLRVESRIEIRQDFVALGISEYFEEIRMKSMAMYAKAGTIKDPIKKSKKKKPKPSTPPMSPVAKPSTPPPPVMGRQSSQGLPSPGSYLPSPGMRPPSLSLPPPSPAVRQTSVPGLPPTVKIGVAGKKAALPEPLVSVESPVHSSGPVNDPWAESPSFGLDDGSGSESDEDDPSALSATELQIREQLDNMERQMEVFEVFMEDDRKNTLYGTTDLSSLDSVVASIMTRVVLDEELRNCFLSILQQLLFIPADQVLGKEMWAMCERVTKEIALLSPVDEVRRYELSFDDRKRLLSARDKFTAYLMETAPELSTSSFPMGPIELLRNRAPHDELSDELTTSDDDDDDDNSVADPEESAESAFRAKVVNMLQKGVSLVEIQRTMGLSTGLQMLTPVAGTRADASPALQKYFKLQKMGMPLFQVQMKMQADGMDASVLEQPGMFVDDDGKPLPPPTMTTTAPAPAPTTVQASEHPTFAKFFKLLKMGMPLEHVKLKASSEGVDASMLDTPDKQLPVDVPPAAPAGPAMIPIKEHPKYAKFFKLMKMGMPAMQVELKMQSEGVDPSILSDPEKLVPDPNSTAAPPAPTGPVMVAVKDHSKYAKFFKLLKMGMPAMQVELKMQAEGHDTSLLSTPDKLIPEKEEEAPAPAGPVMVAVKDHPKYAKFFKLMKMGMPAKQVELKMQAEGHDTSLLSTPDKLIPEKEEEAPAGPIMLAAKDHPKYAKFFKLMKMGMPQPQIELKMQAEGFDASILATPNKMIPEKEEEAPAGPVMAAVKDHPKYAKFFKLLKMGMPAMQVELKMQAEGHDTSLLSTPDKMIPEKEEEAPAGPVLIAVKDHPKYAKFFKLQKMGMPPPQIELKMKAEGCDVSLLSTPDKMIPEKDEPVPAGPVLIAVKDHPKYAKFFKLQKMGMPPPQIELKMKAEGCDVTLLSTPDKMIPEKDEEAPAAPSQPVMLAVKDHPKYAKFFKLQKMGMPPPQIELKMKAENLDTSLLATPDKLIPEKEEEAPAPPADVLVKDHPDYAKYLKLKAMGMPLPQIELKMQAEGLNPALLATPDAVVPVAKPLSANVAVNVVKFVAKVKAKPKLRNLYWEPMAAPTETSLWSKIELSDEHQKELDSLTTLFASAPPAVDKEKKKPAAKKKVATRVALIDAKRANNLGIMLARFRLPYPEIKRAVLEIDRDVLTTEKIAALIQFAPEGEELETVKAYTGEVKLLGDAEQYYLEISSVPRYATRLQAVLATWQFDANVEEQRRLIESVNATCAALKANAAIPEILKLVLALGNTLNEGTPRGGAQGFKLSILLKLVQVKAADNSMTLLNYLAIVLRKKNPEWLTFTDQLEALNEASRVTLQVLKAGEAAIKKASSTVVSELELHAKLPSIAENDKFQDAIAPFAEKSVATSAKVVDEFEAMMKTFNECVQWFGEDPDAAGCGPDSFFSIFVSFGQMLAAADRDNERKRIAEEKRVRREAETRKRMEALASSKQQRKGLDSLKEGDAQAIVKKIRGKRSEEKRRELLEQGFDPTSTDSICSNSSRQLKSQDSLETPSSSSTLPTHKEERP